MFEWWRSVYWCPSCGYISVGVRPAKKGERINEIRRAVQLGRGLRLTRLFESLSNASKEVVKRGRGRMSRHMLVGLRRLSGLSI